MELILINSRKIKIMLTSEDMAEYDLKCDSIDYDNAETRRSFRCILDAAKERTGFDAASERVFVQLFPSKSGGCEMYITKLGGMGGNSSSLRQGKERMEIYQFERLEWMTAVCERLFMLGYRGKSSAYYDPLKGGYYLELSSLSAEDGFSKTSFIEEYGRRMGRSAALLYLGEYCRCICLGDAVAVLAGL